MKNNLKINKVSYLYKGWTDGSDESVINNILQKPIYSYVESSYNSLLMMNVHNDNNTCIYNYLVFIDDNGVGYPINSLVSKTENSSDSGAIRIFPKIEISDLRDKDHLVTTSVADINSNIDLLADAVNNIVDTLTNSAVSTRLGLNIENNQEAYNYMTNAANAIESVQQRLERENAQVPNAAKDEAEMQSHDINPNIGL